MSFFVALRKEILEQWRSYRLLIVVAVFVAFGLMSPLIAKFTPELLKLIPEGEQLADLIPPPTAADAVAQYIKNISQFGVILALLMAMGAVAQEKDKGTAALVLVKPMSRSAFLVAKFVALALTFAAGVAIAAAAAYYYTLLLFEPLDVPGWLALNGLMLLFVLVYVALTLFASTMSKSQAVASGLAFAMLIVFASIGALPGVGEYLPAQLLAWGARLLAGSDTASWPALWLSVGIIAAALVGAGVIFKRQEI